ncbi:D-sedoheptulose 7-phosphate isomerase [Campylobacter hyointestinalis]|uniref:Phosphoheptose isomerase n=1 Tax=Campylobacter hyointestinalis subsp. lawsonii TaxID=91353 RepID=A0AAV6EDD6_CAMHY|nr:D-sedoheptulose 7-phosphate isomerase [Campylobacter hyointestinalis]KAB0612162.1 D-sedoheptulose 7-phosphate isomerase [Campylobacter hyointestinalis subsp. lawsonii]QKF69425.1 phosphoheptose isomerase [Campylobacter hyointestinalis subsp. lawsonii]RAZ23118.1 phosphoheptose isomerase [Campylobacter hyointestinalis subsp. lawsonii]RAZ27581.1 phosphoheptose isomerase [Campylobacter hyointestinalis subsp. lawsonii]RAZ37633.1 phosphoheptose isomerase [Campylobacter hyointestinalis subsp. lawso
MEIINQYIKSHFEDSIQVKNQILQDKALIELIQKVALITTNAYKNGFKTMLAGNGGSAADAQHIAGEFVSRFYFDRPGIPSIALTTDTSILTAIGNDYGYDRLFARQVQAQGVKGDIFIGISTSGNSTNIIEALKVCKEKEIISVGLTGQSGGKMADLCDYCIKVPSNCTPRIQESHIVIGHIICAIVEEEIFGKGFK